MNLPPHRALAGPRRLRRVTALLLAVGAGAASHADHIGRNLEALAGRLAAETLAREYGTFDDPLLTEWVDRIGARVAAECPRQAFPFRFRILDTAEVNAYSLPGAHIFVTRGLLARAESEDEVGAVLAHEVGHLADRDFQRLLVHQLIYLGLGEAVDRAGGEEYLPALRIVQLLDTLRQSRSREDQADQRGLEFALAARYDPLALTAFFDEILGTRKRPRPEYRNVLATHPDAYERRRRTIERTRCLAAEDPQRLLALADDLASRSRYTAALGALRMAHELAPGDPRPVLREAEWQVRRGEREAALDAARRARQLSPGDPAPADLERQALELPPLMPTPPGASVPELPVDRAALDRLRRLVQSLERDRRFSEALVWAQLYRPEADDYRWVLLAVRARLLLMATDRLRWRLSEVSALTRGGSGAWTRLPAQPEADAAEHARICYDRAVKQGIRAGEELRLATRLLPTVLAALLLSGHGDPLGRMNSSRVALLAADLLMVQTSVDRALDHCRAAACAAAQAETERLTCALDGLAATAGDRQRAVYAGLCAARFAVAAEELQARSQQVGGLGRACLALALERPGPDARSSPGVSYQQAEAVRIALSHLTREAKTETIGAALP